jgi:hypothetical protein
MLTFIVLAVVPTWLVVRDHVPQVGDKHAAVNEELDAKSTSESK